MTLVGRDFTRLTFDDAVDAMQASTRGEVSDFTETDTSDAMVQWFRAVGYHAARATGMIDLASGETHWTSMLRRSAAIALCALVGERLRHDVPAVVNVLIDVSGTPGPADVIIPDEAIFYTGGDADTEGVRFENRDGDIVPGNLTLYVLALDGGVYGTPAVGTVANPWGATPAVNDAILYGHPALLFSKVNLVSSGASVPTAYTTSLEYYDGYYTEIWPDDGPAITVSGTQITMPVKTLLFADTGYTRDVSGLVVRVQSSLTKQWETCSVFESGGNYFITTIGTLGQSTVSTSPFDYTLTAEWLPFPVSANYSATGAHYDRDVGGALPDEYVDPTFPPHPWYPWARWQKKTLAGQEAYWLRERVVTVTGGAAAPTNVAAAVTDDNVWTVSVDAVQGESVTETLGTTTGAAFEYFELTQEPYIEGSIENLDVAGDTDWEYVDSLYGHGASDKVFTLVQEPDETIRVVFGNGVYGLLPPPGSLVRAFFRIGAEENGNVARSTVGILEAGSGFAGNVRNPRPAEGWQQRQAYDEDGLEIVRRTIPGAVRAKGRIVVPSDCEPVIYQDFLDSFGRQPFARVVPVQLGAGPKTLTLVCVPAADWPMGVSLDDLDEFLNGVRVGLQRFGGVVLSNQEVQPVHYAPAFFALTITVDVIKGYTHLASGVVERAIRASFTPTARLSSGSWRWWCGRAVTDGHIKTIIGEAGVEGLVDVTIASVPALPYTLSSVGLPMLYSLTINVNEVV